MYMLKVLGALPRSPRALTFCGWSMYRTLTLRQPHHPSFIVPRLPGTAVCEAFPIATIIRPGPMFGHEDKFLTNMPCMSLLSFSLLPDPSLYNQCGLSGGSSITARPRLTLYMSVLITSLHLFILPTSPKVLDVAQALLNLFGVPTIECTLALPGPSSLTYEYLLALVSTLTCNPPSCTPVVPKRVALALVRAA